MSWRVSGAIGFLGGSAGDVDCPAPGPAARGCSATSTVAPSSEKLKMRETKLRETKLRAARGRWTVAESCEDSVVGFEHAAVLRAR
ncbi:MAG: hypothetical protein ACOY0T_27955 [Myxococcota bacterium]